SAIFSDEHFVVQTFHRVVRQRIVLISAENQTDRRILANLRPMLASKVAVNVHLSDVRMSESANFDINDYEATQPTMEKHQVHPKPLMADPQPLLPPNEGKLVAEFEQEAFEMSNQRLLQFALGIFILQAKEFEHHRTADFLIGSRRIFWLRLFTFQQHRCFVLR